jgi:hypothetical protein
MHHPGVKTNLGSKFSKKHNNKEKAQDQKSFKNQSAVLVERDSNCFYNHMVNEQNHEDQNQNKKISIARGMI